jgi:hypothetical protein
MKLGNKLLIAMLVQKQAFNKHSVKLIKDRSIHFKLTFPAKKKKRAFRTGNF